MLSDQQDPARQHQQAERRIAAGPAPALIGEPEARLEKERVGEKRAERGEIAHAVEDVGPRGGRILARDVPALQERSAARDREEGKPDQDGEGAHHQEGGRRCLCGGEDLDASESGAPSADGQGAERHEEQAHVKSDLTSQREVGRGDVRIRVPEEQRRLEEDQRGGPHRRRAAEGGQHHLAHEGLDEEEEEGAQEDGEREERAHLVRAHVTLDDGRAAGQCP